MGFIHEKEANSILPKSGLKYLVAVTPSIGKSIGLIGLEYHVAYNLLNV